MVKRPNPIKRLGRFIWDWIESFLDTWPKKIFFLLCLIGSILLSAYLIACLDVGIRHADITIGGMMEAYREPTVDYPWGILSVFVICILLIATIIIWKNGSPTNGRNFKLSKSNVYGSGREITLKELKQVARVTHKNATSSTILGQLDEEGRQVISSRVGGGSVPNDNMLVFGPPGCGKSTSYVLPYIAQAIARRHSVICSDTKGEVYAKTVEMARRHGYRVLRLDLKDPEHSDGWHVLKELRHDDVRALIFAKTVMANTGEPDQFSAPQESLLKACCLYQERCPEVPEEQRTFYNAYSLLLQGAESMDSTITGAFSAHGECMQVVSEAYANFLQGSPNLRGNIITGLSNRLGVLSTPAVRNMTSTDEIDFANIGLEPTILYISMSDQHQAMSFLASLAFSFAFLDLVDLADRSKGQKLKVPVSFLMEEFGNLGYIPNIDKYLSTARSRGISINLVVQSLAQLTGIYEEDLTSTILADCATWMCLGCNDRDTAELLEWRSGEATVNVRTVQHEAMEPSFKLTHRHSTGDGRRAFYTSNDIMKIRARQEAFIVWQQMDALKCNAFPIFQHQEFLSNRMPEVLANSIIPLSNVKAKQIFRQWEEERIQAFNTWMEHGGDPLQDYSGLRKHTFGPAASEDIPEIVHIHSLERMALAKAAGQTYIPMSDPDSELYDPRYDPDNKAFDANLYNAVAGTNHQPNTQPAAVVAEDLIWDLSDMELVMTSEEEDANTNGMESYDPANPAIAQINQEPCEMDSYPKADDMRDPTPPETEDEMDTNILAQAILETETVTATEVPPATKPAEKPSQKNERPAAEPAAPEPQPKPATNPPKPKQTYANTVPSKRSSQGYAQNADSEAVYNAMFGSKFEAAPEKTEEEKKTTTRLSRGGKNPLPPQQ